MFNKRNLKAVVLFIPIVIWDVFYWSVKMLYKGCTWIDVEGGKLIDEWIEEV
jgi:hypothetical protein